MTERDIKVDTSSIGPGWPPQESSFNRIKGFNNRGVIREGVSLEPIVTTLGNFEQTQAADQAIDRISIRSLIANDILDSHLDILGRYAEVVIPLSGTQPSLEDTSIVYFGFNGPNRQPIQDELEGSLQNVKQARRHTGENMKSVRERVYNNGYRVEVLDYNTRNVDQTIKSQMAALYARFGCSNL